MFSEPLEKCANSSCATKIKVIIKSGVKVKKEIKMMSKNNKHLHCKLKVFINGKLNNKHVIKFWYFLLTVCI